MSDEVRQSASGERLSTRITKSRVLLKDAQDSSQAIDADGIDPRHLPRYKPIMCVFTAIL